MEVLEEKLRGLQAALGVLVRERVFIFAGRPPQQETHCVIAPAIYLSLSAECVIDDEEEEEEEELALANLIQFAL